MAIYEHKFNELRVTSYEFNELLGFDTGKERFFFFDLGSRLQKAPLGVVIEVSFLYISSKAQLGINRLRCFRDKRIEIDAYDPY